ncbi:MAG TPA: hypothetical protein VLH75_20360 [Longimicrobiales bacterium]|nr:hypothetical protein [Longimicrobiales bacterium]
MSDASRPEGPLPIPLRAARGIAGIALLVAAYAPLHRLLDPARTGLAGAATRASAEVAWSLGVWGTLVVAGLALAAAVLVRSDPASWGVKAARRLALVPAGPFAAGAAGVAFVLSAGVARGVFVGEPTSVDEMVQLLHARALLSGNAALPLPGDAASWMVQNSLLTPAGWASVYPPLHTVLLAGGIALGAPWLVGPLAAGTAAGLASLAFVRLMPERPALARAAGALVAVAPFGVLLAGTHLSHATAAAFAALVLWAALKARDEGAGWGALAGAATGAFVCTRPWTGIVLSGALLVAAWGPPALRRGVGWSARRAAALAAGGAPFAVLLLAWNHALFGSLFRLGYAAAYGPAHGLGLHPDPWGNAYGPREALAYTGSDLTHLGATLLESPLPALSLVALALVLVVRLPRGSGLLLVWALAGVGANAAYWHHGIHLGPRMLYETVPAWVALWAVSAAALGGASSPLPPLLRRAAAWAALLSLAGAAVLAPARALGYRSDVPPARALQAPGAPAVVFAHGSWASRVSARLAAAGMRRDSIETALRRNDLCAADAYARWRQAGAKGEAPDLDLHPAPGPAPHLRPELLSPGNAALLRPGAVLVDACLREARSDRLGTVELEPLLWKHPPVPGASLVVARDLGPAANARTLLGFPGATPWVLVDGGPGAPARVVPYVEGMEMLWGGAAGVSGGGG